MYLALSASPRSCPSLIRIDRCILWTLGLIILELQHHRLMRITQVINQISPHSWYIGWYYLILGNSVHSDSFSVTQQVLVQDGRDQRVSATHCSCHDTTSPTQHILSSSDLSVCIIWSNKILLFTVNILSTARKHLFHGQKMHIHTFTAFSVVMLEVCFRIKIILFSILQLVFFSSLFPKCQQLIIEGFISL